MGPPGKTWGLPARYAHLVLLSHTRKEQVCRPPGRGLHRYQMKLKQLHAMLQVCYMPMLMCLWPSGALV